LRRFQGQSDIPLDAKGRAQAKALAALLHADGFDVAVSSDLSRAYETARIICGRRAVERDPRWREFAFGEWEGLTWDEICGRWPHLAPHGATAAKLYTPVGGESFEAVRERVAQAIGDLRSRRCARALIVTHAGPLHAMLHTFFGDREAEMAEALAVRFSPGSVTRITVDDAGNAELLTLNEVAY
jgi:broad specificity phosphatase PhoE